MTQLFKPLNKVNVRPGDILHTNSSSPRLVKHYTEGNDTLGNIELSEGVKYRAVVRSCWMLCRRI